MPLEFINLNSPPVVAVNSDNGKAMGEKNGTGRVLKDQQKIITWSQEIKFEINKELRSKQLLL